MKIRDRVIELRRVRAGDLIPNPRNWRRHSDAQADAMRGVLAEVGFAGAELVRETPEGLQLIDGHLRAELAPDAELPCLVLDVDEAEAGLLLASYDPLASMAEADPGALGKLLAEVETESEALRAMLDGLAEGSGLFDVDGAEMPDLPTGDRAPFQQMTFTLSDEQAGDVKRAVDGAKKAGPFVDTGNENSNGNALARIVEAYLGTC